MLVFVHRDITLTFWPWVWHGLKYVSLFNRVVNLFITIIIIIMLQEKRLSTKAMCVSHLASINYNF